jgi:hypothetical protein
MLTPRDTLLPIRFSRIRPFHTTYTDTTLFSRADCISAFADFHELVTPAAVFFAAAVVRLLK